MTLRSNLLIALVLLVTIGNASAVLLSDQGTNVRDISTGDLLTSGNLTIKIYESSSGGSPLFESTIQNAIVNGSWNLMINPSLEYGKSYWKDYEINSENVDFDGNDRMEFQSPLGLINNVSFINLSLISSCASGSSIRLIYANGSVECEADDTGSGSSADLTNYALKNQSETFSGNITTAQTGFFGWLGNLTSRITKLFVQDIDASGNVNIGNNLNVTNNISARYFVGDGSRLTGITAAGANDTIWNITNSNYLINSSGVLAVNETRLNSTITAQAAQYNDTTLIKSINASLTAQLAGINTSSSSFNATYQTYAYNQTSVANAYTDAALTANNASWLSTYNSTYAAKASTGTCPAGQVVQNTTSGGVQCITPTVTESDPVFLANNASLWAEAKSKYNSSYESTYNSSYATYAYNQTTGANSYADALNATQTSWIVATFLRISDAASQFLNSTQLRTQYYNKSDIDARGYINSSDAAAYNDTSYINTLVSNNNASWSSTYNTTYATYAYNQTYSGSTYNSTYAAYAYNQTSAANTYTDAVIAASNASWLSTYNATYAANAANNSWNQTLASTLYAGIQWNYNQTAPAITYVDSVVSAKAGTAAATCPAGQVVQNVTTSTTGVTLYCVTPTASETDALWTSNLTNGVSADLVPNTNIIQSLGSSAKQWLVGWFQDLDVSRNITLGGNISAQYYFGSLNKSTFPVSTCSGTDKVVGIYQNGTVACGTDQSTSSSTAIQPLTMSQEFTIVGVSSFDPFFGTAISSGTAAAGTGTSEHIGVARLADSTTANGGYRIMTDITAMLLEGNETAVFIFRHLTGRLTSSYRMGFQDSTAIQTVPTDGCWFEVNSTGPTNNASMTGRCRNNAGPTYTASAFTLTANSWYEAILSVNSAGTMANFTLYNETGAIIWSQNVSSNIPIVAGRETGLGIIAGETTTDAAASIVDIDYMGLIINRTLTR